MELRVALFGQPRVLSAEGSCEVPLLRKTLDVLAYLILHRKRPPTRDSIAFALFPDEDEEKARGRLRRNLSELLNAIPDGRRYITVDSERIAWNLEAPAHVDVIEFERAVGEGRDDDALDQYAGELLPTLYDEWTAPHRERLRDMFHDVLLRSISQQRARRLFDAATAGAHRLLEEDPWREDVVRLLISIRYEAGDRAGALAAFERFAVRLRDEMRAEPMPETIALRDAVLRGARLATSDPQRTGGGASTAPMLPFVGRDAALLAARARWQLAADGRAGVLFVSGEAGTGKSRFATELARIVESEGGIVLRGYTGAGGEHRPYEAFVEAFASAPGLLDAHADAVLTDDRAARVRLFDSVRRRVSELSRTRPMVVILEDLHWAGAATVDLVEFVARRLDEAPVLLVATFRSDELSRAHPLRPLRRQLQASGFGSEIHLDRLNADDAMRAARAALPESSDEAGLARAVAWADGVPLLLAEALRDLAAGRTSSAPDISSLVGERFERLSPGAETVLLFGAVLGERFDLAALAAATAWRDDEILDALAESIELGLVRATSRAPGLAFAFTHDLIRVATIERISEQELARAHGLVARALCAQGKDDDARAAEIARHFFAAGETLRAAEYLRRGARYALDVFANEDARDVASAGLALCDESDPAQRPLRYALVALREESEGRLGAVEARRADARLLVELADSDEALIAALEREYEANRDNSAMRAQTVAALGRLAETSSEAAGIFAYTSAKHAFADADFVTASTAAVRAAELLVATGQHRKALFAEFLRANVLTRLGRSEESQAVIARLRADMESSDDLPMRAEFHRAASSALADVDYEKALVDARQSLVFALRVGDRYAEARARQNIGTIAGRLGAYEEALAENERSYAAYRDVDDRAGMTDVSLNTASQRLFCGDYSGTRRLLDEIDAAPENPWQALRHSILRAFLEAHNGNPTLAALLLTEVRDHAGSIGAELHRWRMEVELMRVLAMGGRLDAAAQGLEPAIEGLRSLRVRSVFDAEACALLARIYATLGHVERAREQAGIALRDRPHMQSFSEIAWNAAAAYALIGDEAAARELAERAAAAAVRDALAMPADLAETYLSLPWHRETVAYLSGRPVALRLAERAITGAIAGSEVQRR